MSKNIKTQVIHGGISEDKNTGGVSIPIYQSATFRQSAPGKHKGYEYGRTGNPTREAIEALIADLEEGSAGFAFASGLAALTTLMFLFKAGDKILISQNVYGGTLRILSDIFNNFGLAYEITASSDVKSIEKILKNDKKIAAIIFETPANPILTIYDIKGISKIAKKYGVLTIVDNTFMTPYLQKPLALGADIVVHSATKYLGGHSDIIAGLVAVKDSKIAEKIKFFQNAAGAILEPFDSWLLIRSIKTLSVRMDRHEENAQYLAAFLKKIPAIEKIFYPGFKDFKGYNIHKKQAKGAGGMISFTLKKDYSVNEFFKNLKIIILAESLGGAESLICHPASMTHASVPEKMRKEIGIADNLIRFSVGIEDKKDLAEDLEQAFKKSKKS